jgi:SAM-dependent methyltransferase
MGFDRLDVQNWFRNAGLVNVLLEDTEENCSSGSQVGSETASVSIFVAVGSKAVPGMEDAVGAHYREIAGSGSGCCGESLALPGFESSDKSIPLNVIQSGSSSCCGPVDIQATEAEFSLGCGNPVPLAELRAGQVVLDIGSGAGADAFPAAKRVGPEGRVIGVDRLPEMVERARLTAAAHGYENVEFRLGDALDIPLEDNAVDVVLSNCVINLLQDKGEAFRQAHRVLKSGGSLSISDIVTDRPFSPALRADPDSWAGCVAGALPESEYLGLIAAAGFIDITVTRSQPWTAEDGTQVYSLSVKAAKA